MARQQSLEVLQPGDPPRAGKSLLKSEMYGVRGHQPQHAAKGAGLSHAEGCHENAPRW